MTRLTLPTLALPTEARRLFGLALPLILAQLAQTSMGFVDTLMVGRLGREALAGIALGSTVYFFVFLIVSGAVLAVGPLVSQAHGGGQREAIGRTVRQGLWLATALGGLALLAYWNVAPALRLAGQDEGTVALASAYLRAISWGLLPGLWLVALRGLLEGVSQTRPILIIILFGVGLNVFANHTLMFGNFGFPALGLVGTGFASAFVYWVVFALAALYVQSRHGALGILSKWRLPDLGAMRELVTVGWPISLTLAFESGLPAHGPVGRQRLGRAPDRPAERGARLHGAARPVDRHRGQGRSGAGTRRHRRGAPLRPRRHRPGRPFHECHGAALRAHA
jgi:MATE family multidrug resistance protein